MTTIAASEVKPSDILHFSGSNYRVRSVLLKSDVIRISFWNTNDEQYYFYEPTEQMERVNS